MSSTALSFDPPNRRDPFTIVTDHVDSYTNGHPPSSDSLSTPDTPKSQLPPAYNISGIALRAFSLGLVFGISTVVAALLAVADEPFWRLPFFLSALSLFHFLEFQITAAYNPSAATVSAFLLTTNGKAYNTAHGLAFLECSLRLLFKPYSHSALSQIWRFDDGTVSSLQSVQLALGFGMLVVGQVTRTMAMAHAGSNFSHTVQMKKRHGHVLVTDGIYGWLRHPSYFGFFWWGLGTQMVIGNVFCLAGYTVVLWRFFRHRIRGESCPRES